MSASPSPEPAERPSRPSFDPERPRTNPDPIRRDDERYRAAAEAAE